MISLWDEFVLGAYLTLATFFSLAGSFSLIATYLFATSGNLPWALYGVVSTLLSFYGVGMFFKKAYEKWRKML